MKSPFEVHVTVKNDGPDTVALFIMLCNELKIKPLLIEMNTTEGTVVDLVTSSTVFGDGRVPTEAYMELFRIVIHLQNAGLQVVRQKIETWTYHEDAPSRNNADTLFHNPNQYFESHLECRVPERDLTRFSRVLRKHKAHLSRNTLKAPVGDSLVQIATIRSFDMIKEDFMEKVLQFEKDLNKHNIEVEDSPEIEFALFDTNIFHDDTWFNVES